MIDPPITHTTPRPMLMMRLDAGSGFSGWSSIACNARFTTFDAAAVAHAKITAHIRLRIVSDVMNDKTEFSILTRAS